MNEPRLIELVTQADVLPSSRNILLSWLAERAERDVGLRRSLARGGLHRRPALYGRPAICVDVGGVLLGPTTQWLTTQLGLLFDLPEEVVSSHVMRPGKLADQMNRGQLSSYEVLEALAKLSSRIVSFEDFNATWIESLSPRHQNIETLRLLILRFPELQWVYATNVDPMKNEALLGHYDWYSVLDKLFASCEMKVAKPEPRFFSRVAADLGCDLENLFLLDDKPSNLEAASDHGMGSLLVSRTDSLDLEAVAAILDVWLGRLAV